MTGHITDFAAAGSLTGTELLEVSQLSTTVKITATTLSAQASDNSYNDSASGFVTAGFAVGDRVNVVGFTGNVANNITVGIITALTNAKMTIGGTDGDVIVDDAAGESVTIAKWTTRRTTASGLAGLASGYTDENARDAVMAMLVGAGLLVETENDAGDTDTLTVNAAAASDIQAGSSTTKAVTPGALADASAPQTLTDGATVNWDMSVGFNAKVTLGGNRILAVSNPRAGWTYSLNIVQDATGTRTVTWPSSFDWGSAGAPTLTTTANKRDRITLFCTDAATPKFDAFLSGKGFA